MVAHRTQRLTISCLTSITKLRALSAKFLEVLGLREYARVGIDEDEKKMTKGGGADIYQII